MPVTEQSFARAKNKPLAGYKIAVLTNARMGEQRSMIGYGELLLDAARGTGAHVTEWRCLSFLSRLPLSKRWLKLALQIDRFLLTPFAFMGRRADLVHVADHGNAIYLPFVRARKTVVTVHDLIPFLARDGRLAGFTPSFLGRLAMRATLFCLMRTGTLISPSTSTIRDLIAYLPGRSEQTRMVPNAVFQPLERVSLTEIADFRRSHNIKADAPLVLHVGRGFYKNRGFVLEVFARVRQSNPEARLLLVGTLEPALASRAAQLGLNDELCIISEVPRDYMAALYSSANVLLFPSLYEGFGYPVVEAGLCGTPVVCSDCGSLAEVAREATVLPLAAGAADFAKAVLAALDAPPQFVAPICTQDDWIGRHHTLYAELLIRPETTE